MMYKPFIAGLLIALGGYANMKVGGALGAFLFSLGLLSVIRFKTPLYTGMVSDLKKYGPAMFDVIFYNMIGALFLAGFVLWQGGIDSQVNILAKLDKTFPMILFDSFICGLCVSIAVKSKSVYMTILAVALFVICGGEHCVADVYYFIASGIANLEALRLVVIAILGNTLGGLLFAKVEEFK